MSLDVARRVVPWDLTLLHQGRWSSLGLNGLRGVHRNHKGHNSREGFVRELHADFFFVVKITIDFSMYV